MKIVKKIPLISFLCALTILGGCANLRNSETSPGLGTALDAATTYYGLEFADAAEANPLLSWGNPAAAALGSIALKQGFKYVAVNHFHADPFVVDTNVETAGMAAGMWNIGVIAGVNPAVGLVAALASAYGYYQYRQRQQMYIFPIERGAGATSPESHPESQEKLETAHAATAL